MAIKDLTPIREISENLIVVPTFLTGKLKKEVLPEYGKEFGNNSYFDFYDTDKEFIRGSNIFIVGGLNKILEGSQFRTAVPTDNIYEAIFPMIKGNFYTDLNALDVWKAKPKYKKNNGIWRLANELAEEHLGKSPSGTFRIQGVYCVIDEDEEGYNARILPAKNFRIISPSDMPEYEGKNPLDLESGTKFDVLDQNGLIIPKRKGKFTKGTLGNGVSGVYLYGDGGLDSDGDGLAYSDDNGRVVVLDAEGVVPKFSAESYKIRIEESYKSKVSAAERIRKKALEDLAKL